jgi:hypothetical protein
MRRGGAERASRRPTGPAEHHLPMEAATEAGLVDIINRHGGKGPVAVPWYDLGKRGEYLFAWQITRWEQALPIPKQPPVRE